MIFLSHNHNDKMIVENIAINLLKFIPQDEIFYDSWSIQPGDGIIDKMNQGLEKCKFFILFISEHSLKSNAVKMEWQNTLMNSLGKNIKIVLVKLDNSEMPVILKQNLYLDLYNNGLDITITQIVDVIKDRNIFKPTAKIFSNLNSFVTYNDNSIDVKICAEYFLEAIPRFFITFKNLCKENDVHGSCEETCESKLYEKYDFNNGTSTSGFYIKVFRGLNPKNPINLTFTTKNNMPLEITSILHIEGADKGVSNFSQIPTSYSSSNDPLFNNV